MRYAGEEQSVPKELERSTHTGLRMLVIRGECSAAVRSCCKSEGALEVTWLSCVNVLEPSLRDKAGPVVLARKSAAGP